ncbi:MAG: OsmC family protein [Burkholderiaceae bacterium]|nr:OsmC family protein [Burkholderiaceae bacterium]
MSEGAISVRLVQAQDYQFDLDFGAGVPALRADEPPPLGQGTGPSPVQLLAGAVGNCLSASLLFALRKFKQAPEPIHTEVTAEVGRNADGRLRVLGMQVTLTLGVPAAQLQHLDRVLGGFEAYCTVTQSVSGAIPVAVSVRDAQGVLLK